MSRVEFVLPDVGEGLEEGEIVAWLVAPGDTVARDQPLVEVQTDKALVELPSPVSGQVVSLAFGPGDLVKVGQTLVVLDAAPGAPVPGAPVPGATTTGAMPPDDSAASTGPTSLADQGSPGGRPKAAPAVRKLALERGVELGTVTGTGPGGRILAGDVERAATTGVPDRAIGAVSNAGPSVSPGIATSPGNTTLPGGPAAGGLGWLEPGRHPLRGIRRLTAEAMARSWSEIPHMTTLDEVDATGLLAARRRLAAAGIDATIGALLVAAVARGLRRYPLLNASLDLTPSATTPHATTPHATTPSATTPFGGTPVGGSPREADGGRSGGSIVVHPDCNIGLAVATADGLLVPVVKRADRRGLADLAAEVGRLTAAARDRRVDVADLRGGTFTISNYGAFGGRFATPLIRPPEVGIMGFGAIRPRPFVVDGEVKARPTLPWSLSADHRLIDGDVATAFAEYVTGLLAEPVALLAELLAAGA